MFAFGATASMAQAEQLSSEHLCKPGAHQTGVRSQAVMIAILISE